MLGTKLTFGVKIKDQTYNLPNKELKTKQNV